MNVLVAYAGAHDSAAGVAEQIADRLLKSGFAATARPVGRVDSLQSYRAVVLGSPIHHRAWLAEATDFLDGFAGELTKLPVWLFSTGSVGDASFVGPQPTKLIRSARQGHGDVTSARDSIHFRDHRSFASRLERAAWSVLGDLFLKVCGAVPGDYRDWHEINEWAAGIARELQVIDHVKERRRLHVSVRGKP
ncbi:MAG TPA: flavodoxin domain-containing protein [Polyangiaceae bacterium]|nr:flavodoxin domain-containing protein [Polyangiaceae bacterium]